MTYSGGSIDVRKSARFSAGFGAGELQNAGIGSARISGAQTAPLPSSPLASSSTPYNNIQSSFQSALFSVSEADSTNPENSAYALAPASPTIDDDIAELASIISSQKHARDSASISPRSIQSSSENIGATASPLSAPSPTPALSPTDDFAKELAEFEELLNAKK